MESEQASPHCQETFKLKLLITLYPPKEKKAKPQSVFVLNTTTNFFFLPRN